MFAAIQDLFLTVSMFCKSLQSLAKASNHLSTWAEEAAGQLADEARVQRTAKLKQLNTENQLQIEQAQ